MAPTVCLREPLLRDDSAECGGKVQAAEGECAIPIVGVAEDGKSVCKREGFVGFHNGMSTTNKETLRTLWKLGVCIVIGLALWFVDVPGMPRKAWHLFAIFVAIVAGIVIKPLPYGATLLLGMGVAILTKTLTFQQAFSGFNNQVPWTVLIAYFIAEGFKGSGLGRRIATWLVSIFGRTTIGLAYSLVLTDFLLAPAIPSTAARAAGVVVPLGINMCKACGSDPADGTHKKLGSYVIYSSFICSRVCCATFLTAVAANYFTAEFAYKLSGIQITWASWLLASCAPSLACLFVMPLLTYFVYPPTTKYSPDAPIQAKADLEAMGPMKRDEIVSGIAMLLTISLWVCGTYIGVGLVSAALIGLSVLLVSHTVTWSQCLKISDGWDVLVWFAGLIAMADFLKQFGFIEVLTNAVVKLFDSLPIGWFATFVLIVLLYSYSHLLFASATAHIAAMYGSFLAILMACGVPTHLSVVALAHFTHLSGCFTVYGASSGPVYMASGYITQGEWTRLGFFNFAVLFVIWMGVGLVWWKAIGIW